LGIQALDTCFPFGVIQILLEGIQVSGMDSEHRSAPFWVWFNLFVVWLCWGTTYLAIREGVSGENGLPPLLFAGVRITLAGIILVLFFLVWRKRFRLNWSQIWPVWLSGVFLFVGGNGLCTIAEMTVESGLASVLIATTPLWLALFDVIWPGGDRMNSAKWLGMLAGFGGVCIILLGPSLVTSSPISSLWEWERGNFIALGSAFAWAIGSIIQRRLAPKIDAIQIAGWQMLTGGASLTVLGLCFGELNQITNEKLNPTTIGAFFYLLFIGSLIGFVAFVWLLHHTTPAIAGTYGYVNPVVAVWVGWLLGGESPGWVLVPGMALILLAVFLVRMPGKKIRPTS